MNILTTSVSELNKKLSLIILLAFLLFISNNIYSQDPRYINSRDHTVLIDVTVQTEPAPKITLNWLKKELGLGYEIRRKTIDNPNFPTTAMAVLDSNTTTFEDTDVQVGVFYEYEIRCLSYGSMILQFRDQNNNIFDSTVARYFMAFGYNSAGIEVDRTDDPKKIIILVDSLVNEVRVNEIDRMVGDIISDGWGVIKKVVPRSEEFDSASVKNNKKLILEEWEKDPQYLKAVLLIGRVAVPYSGNIAPDGHGNHVGAWPADVYYGYMNENFWTDISVNNVTASRENNKNIPGDGKFDQNNTSGRQIELAVGRIDFYNMPAFEEDEMELLLNYLQKDHDYRRGRKDIEYRGIVDDNFGSRKYLEGFGSSGWRNIAALTGKDNTYSKDWFSTLRTDTYLWAYGCGGGTYISAGGIGKTFNSDTSNKNTFVQSEVHSIFTMLFGSYFGDWDSENNFLRAALCSKPDVLTCTWSGRPHWFYHHMGLGLPIAYSTLISHNNYTNYLPNLYFLNGINQNPLIYAIGFNSVHNALMGDPTLRMWMGTVPRPNSLAVYKPGHPAIAKLEWDIPNDLEGDYYFNVYRAKSTEGPFFKINDQPIKTNTYTDEPEEEGKYVYLLRTVQLQESNSGSFYNMSHGLFQELLVVGVDETEDNFEFTCSPVPAVDNLKINLQTNKFQYVDLNIYDMRGMLVKSVYSGSLGAGESHFGWDLTDNYGKKIASGIYLAEFNSGDLKLIRKIIVIQ